jgi:hypothetical protein
MADLRLSPQQRYREWIEARIEEHKAELHRDELLELADEAVRELFDNHDGQYPLTEILLRDAVDSLVFRRLDLPSYRKWLRTYQSDTPDRPPTGTPDEDRPGGGVVELLE